MEKLFKKPACNIFENTGDHKANDKQQENIILYWLRGDQDRGDRESIYRTIGSKQESPIGIVMILDGAVTGFPQPANDGIGKK